MYRGCATFEAVVLTWPKRWCWFVGWRLRRNEILPSTIKPSVRRSVARCSKPCGAGPVVNAQHFRCRFAFSVVCCRASHMIRVFEADQHYSCFHHRYLIVGRIDNGRVVFFALRHLVLCLNYKPMMQPSYGALKMPEAAFKLSAPEVCF